MVENSYITLNIYPHLAAVLCPSSRLPKLEYLIFHCFVEWMHSVVKRLIFCESMSI